MYILVIEDDEALAREIEVQIRGAIPGSTVDIISSFDRALPVLRRSHYDAVILDLYEGLPGPASLRGDTIWEEIWRHAFVPIIVHTGGEEHLDPPAPVGHPFVRILQKGPESVAEIVQVLQEFVEASGIIRDLYQEFREAISTSLRDAVPALLGLGIPREEALRVLAGVGRRRIAARLDVDTLVTGVTPKPFERYIYPPLARDLLTGDIVRRKEQRNGTADDFFVVLTPSCDLVEGPGHAAAREVLLARCKDMNFFARKEALPRTNAEKLRDRLPVSLRSPRTLGLTYLPELRGVFPNMIVDARDILLLSMERFHHEYERIASVDSPFREHIVWTFIQAQGRPNLPDHDLTDVIESIVRDIREASP